MQQVSLVINEREAESGRTRLRLIVNDPDMQGNEYDFTLKMKVDVYQKNGVNHESDIYSQSLRVENGKREYEFLLPRNTLPVCEYEGELIRTRCTAELRPVGIRGIVSSIKIPVHLSESRLPEGDPDPEDIMEPHDERSYFKNLFAISGKDRVEAMGLLIAAGVVILINSIIGIHDQMTPDNLSWLYTDTGGRNGDPLVKSMIGSSMIGAGVFTRLQIVLRRYMEFSMKRFRGRFKRGKSYPLKKLIAGKSRIRMENIEIRVVAANIEHGVVKERNSKGNMRKVSFANATRGVTLFRKRIPVVEAGVPLSDYIQTDMVSFDRVFDHLYPEFFAKKAGYGLQLSWEVQLIHPELTDQELVGEGKSFDTASFSVAMSKARDYRQVA